MRFFIDAKLVGILALFSVTVIVWLFADILISLFKKTSYISNMLYIRWQFAIWIVSVWLFGIFPIWLALLVWFTLFFALKYCLLRKTANRIAFFIANEKCDSICPSFRQCIRQIFNKNDINLSEPNNGWKNIFTLSEYSNTLVLIPLYYLFGIVSLYPEARIGFVIGVYLIAIAIFVLIARLVRAILNQKGNVFERGLYSWIFIIVLGIVYFVLLTLVIKNLGSFSA